MRITGEFLLIIMNCKWGLTRLFNVHKITCTVKSQRTCSQGLTLLLKYCSELPSCQLCLWVINNYPHPHREFIQAREWTWSECCLAKMAKWGKPLAVEALVYDLLAVQDRKSKRRCVVYAEKIHFQLKNCRFFRHSCHHLGYPWTPVLWNGS